MSKQSYIDYLCTDIANKVEQEIQTFDEHLSFDEEREKVFRLGILHAVTRIGYAFRNNEPVIIDTDYERFNKKYEMYHGLKEVRTEAKAEEKAHQISMEEYIASQNKSAQDSKTASDNLAEKVAETVILYLDKLLKKVDKKPKKDK